MRGNTKRPYRFPKQYDAIARWWNDLRCFDNAIHFCSKNIQGDLSKIIAKCNEAGGEITHIDIRKINLETIFLNLTGAELRDK